MICTLVGCVLSEKEELLGAGFKTTVRHPSYCETSLAVLSQFKPHVKHSQKKEMEMNDALVLGKMLTCTGCIHLSLLKPMVLTILLL